MATTSTFVPCGKSRLHAVEAGRGSAIVCLHANVADARMWAPQLQSLSASHRVVAYDRRGFGETTYEAEPFSHVEDLIALLDALQIDAAVLVGSSMGGRVAIDAALAHPERVKALVLVATGVNGAPAPQQFAPAIQKTLDALQAADPQQDVDTINELEAQLWLDGPAQPAGRVGGTLRELFLAMNGRALRAASPGDERVLPQAWHRLSLLRLPTLVVWGDLDFPHLQARMRNIVVQVPKATSALIEGTAHLPNLERPEPFDRAVLDFLKTVGG
jgi:pimeloyl-ACP methyl ester carboxylesterase